MRIFGNRCQSSIQLSSKCLSVPIVGIQIVALVGGDNVAGVLDWTPILLSAATDLTCVSQEPVAIRAIGTVDFLDGVQIGQVIAIEDEIVLPSDFINLVHRKADQLIYRDKDIEQDKW